MTTVVPAAQFEIKVDGVVRSYRDVRDTAIEAARFPQQHNSRAKVVSPTCSTPRWCPRTPGLNTLSRREHGRDADHFIYLKDQSAQHAGVR